MEAAPAKHRVKGWDLATSKTACKVTEPDLCPVRGAGHRAAGGRCPWMAGRQPVWKTQPLSDTWLGEAKDSPPFLEKNHVITRGERPLEQHSLGTAEEIEAQRG